MFIFCAQDNDRTSPQATSKGAMVGPKIVHPPSHVRRDRTTLGEDQRQRPPQTHAHYQYVDPHSRVMTNMLTPRHRHHHTTHDRTLRRSNQSDQMRGAKMVRVPGRRHTAYHVHEPPNLGCTLGGSATVQTRQGHRHEQRTAPQLRRSQTQYQLHQSQSGTEPLQHEPLSRANSSFTIPPLHDRMLSALTAPINIPRIRGCDDLATDLVLTDDDQRRYAHKTENSSWRMYARMHNSGMRVPSPSEADLKAARDQATATPNDVSDDGIFEIDV